MRGPMLELAATLAMLLATGGCPGGTDAEPMDAAGAERFTPLMVDAAVDGGARDVAASDLHQRDHATPDLAAPDSAAPDRGAVDGTTSDATALDATPPDAAQPEVPAIEDAGVEDAGVEDSGVPTLPPLRVEIDQDVWSDEMYIDWFSPSGLECEEWDDTEQCDWGAEGQISISGDDYGNADPNWAELSGARLRSGSYRAFAYSYCDDMETCAVDEVRVFVDGQLVRTLGEDRDLTYGSQSLCMPVVDGAWDVGAFDWQYMSTCD